MATVKATELVHLTHDGNFQLDAEGRVVLCRVVDDDNAVLEEGEKNATNDNDGRGTTVTLSLEIILDVTTMHPRGGGQPSDVGTVTGIRGCGGGGIVATISDVTIDKSTGVVVHRGVVILTRREEALASGPHTETPPFPPGSTVFVRVDPDRRLLNSECHTAGHVVDAAMARIDASSGMIPLKGYHFQDGPYVEYGGGNIDARERDAFLDGLRAAFQVSAERESLHAVFVAIVLLPRKSRFLNRDACFEQNGKELVGEDMPTVIRTLPADEAMALCRDRLAKNFDFSGKGGRDDNAEGEVRVVTVAGWHAPCGGTHVRSTGELRDRGWYVRGLKCKKGSVRVRYGPAE